MTDKSSRQETTFTLLLHIWYNLFLSYLLQKGITTRDMLGRGENAYFIIWYILNIMIHILCKGMVLKFHVNLVKHLSLFKVKVILKFTGFIVVKGFLEATVSSLSQVH